VTDAPPDIAVPVEDLVARHGRYRPVDLLVARGRLAFAALSQWRAGDLDVLEDRINGNPERWEAMLIEARDWAERRGLVAELVVPGDARGRALRAARAPARQQLLCTEYLRIETGPQLDLFFDNAGVAARNKLADALLAGDAPAAARGLAGLDPAGTEHALQTAAEVLVDALAWRPDAASDPQAALDYIESDLEPAARHFLDARAGPFLQRYWRGLAEALAGRRFEPARPHLHAGRLWLRAGDPAGAIAAIRAEPDYWRHTELLGGLLEAGSGLGERDAMLEALVELCWCDASSATAWLNRIREPGIDARLAEFDQIEPEPPLSLFPAWLALHMPVPRPPSLNDRRALDDGAGHVRLFEAAAALRDAPEDLDARRAVQQQSPALFRAWLALR